MNLYQTLTSDEMASDTDEDENPVMDFELPLHSGPSVDLFRSHSYICYNLQIDTSDKLLMRIFHMLAALCDPMTQPGENGEYLLSVKGLADAATALGYQILLEMRLENQKSIGEFQLAQLLALGDIDTTMLRFTLSLKFFEILNAISVCLRAEDDVRLRHLKNHKDIWERTAQFWLPKLDMDDDDQPLKVIYYMCCTIIMSLYLLFRNDKESANLALNPYLEYFVRLWKSHTSIIQLALEIDRELEEEAWSNKGEYFDTPDNVKRALMGSSAVRIVLAAVLENMFVWNSKDSDKPTNLLTTHDLVEMSMLDFFDPLSRVSPNGGALYNNIDHFALAMLVLRLYTDFSPYHKTEIDMGYARGGVLVTCPSADVEIHKKDMMLRNDPAGMTMDLVCDLYQDDKLDDDVKYVFGHYDSEEESGSETGRDEEDFPMALRRDKDDIEFDEQGRDWRDLIRGSNNNLTTEFSNLLMSYTNKPEEGADYFFTNMDQVEEGLKVFALLEIEYMPKFVQHVGQSLINTIGLAASRTMQNEHDFIDSIHKFLVSPAKQELVLEALQHKPFLIQSRRLTNFELILAFNSKTACAILDELLMVNGLRRLIIWFICHSINLHMSLINHVYELAAGLRGNAPKRESPYKFSRQGALELSPVERLMLLHEFLINSGPWLLSTDEDGNLDVPPQRAEKMVSYLCLMILKLIDEKIIELAQNHTDEFEDYSQDIQVLLFPWIGRVPEARALYFQVKKDNVAPLDTSVDLDTKEKDEEMDDQIQAIIEGKLPLPFLDPETLKYLDQARPLKDGKTYEQFFQETLRAFRDTPDSSDEEDEINKEIKELLYNTFGRKTIDNHSAGSNLILHAILNQTCRSENDRYFDHSSHEVTQTNEAGEEENRSSVRDYPDNTDLVTVISTAYKGGHFSNYDGGKYLHETFRYILRMFPASTIDAAGLIKYAYLFIVDPEYEQLRAHLLGETLENDTNGAANTNSNKNSLAVEAPESEFNDEFLNGEGHFQEGLEDNKPKSKKKKKKKTKRK